MLYSRSLQRHASATSQGHPIVDERIDRRLLQRVGFRVSFRAGNSKPGKTENAETLC